MSLLHGCKAIETHSRFCRFDDQFTMDFRRNPNHEFSAESAAGQGFPCLAHIGNHLCNNFPNSSERSFRGGGQPTQAGKLGTKPNVFLILIRPCDTIGVVIIL